MFSAILLLAAAPATLPPPRLTTIARARIMRATRISFARPQQPAETAQIRRGMIEFR